jgi:hypothetical protein
MQPAGAAQSTVQRQAAGRSIDLSVRRRLDAARAPALHVAAVQRLMRGAMIVGLVRSQFQYQNFIIKKKILITLKRRYMHGVLNVDKIKN